MEKKSSNHEVKEFMAGHKSIKVKEQSKENKEKLLEFLTTRLKMYHSEIANKSSHC